MLMTRARRLNRLLDRGARRALNTFHDSGLHYKGVSIDLTVLDSRATVSARKRFWDELAHPRKGDRRKAIC